MACGIYREARKNIRQMIPPVISMTSRPEALILKQGILLWFTQPDV